MDWKVYSVNTGTYIVSIWSAHPHKNKRAIVSTYCSQVQKLQQIPQELYFGCFSLLSIFTPDSVIFRRKSFFFAEGFKVDRRKWLQVPGFQKTVVETQRV